MPVIKHFINHGIKHMLIEEFLKDNLQNAGYAGCELQKTPLGTRITIKTSRPGIVIGKKGRSIRELTESVKEKFDINVPTIDVDAVNVPEMNATIQAERLAYAIGKGQHHRRAAYGIIRRIMRMGARGVEITIAGKIGSQRARTNTFRAGTLAKCGIPAIEGVDKGYGEIILKSGMLGIIVKIMPGDYKLPDEFEIKKGVFDERKEKESEEPDEFYDDEIISPEDEEEIDEDDLFDSTEDSDENILEDDEAEEIVEIIEDLDEEEEEK